jgi:hypothetical protein
MTLNQELENLVFIAEKEGLTQASEFIKAFLRKYDVVKNKKGKP